jgi:speckle-type POZ protein
VSFHLVIYDPVDDEVTVRYELALLNRDGREIIKSIRSFDTFSRSGKLIEIFQRNTVPLLGDSFQVMCDLTFIEKAAVAVPRPDLHHYLGGLLESQLGGDVTFQSGGELFTAHKCILAARSTVFKDELFGPGKENCASATPIRIEGMEPRVFRALLHFIYTDALPEMEEGDGDKVTMARGLLVAAHRYGMETLKLICGDMLCNHIDARTATTLLQLADSHGCRRLKQACTRAIKDMLEKVATP